MCLILVILIAVVLWPLTEFLFYMKKNAISSYCLVHIPVNHAPIIRENHSFYMILWLNFSV